MHRAHLHPALAACKLTHLSFLTGASVLKHPLSYQYRLCYVRPSLALPPVWPTLARGSSDCALLPPQDAVAGCYVLAQVPRPPAAPPAADGAPAGAAQQSVEELAHAQDAEVLSEAREKLELFITETQDIGVSFSIFAVISAATAVKCLGDEAGPGHALV